MCHRTGVVVEVMRYAYIWLRRYPVSISTGFAIIEVFSGFYCLFNHMPRWCLQICYNRFRPDYYLLNIYVRHSVTFSAMKFRQRR
jgi:hypothetical protein